MSPDSETISNNLVLVAHGTTGDLRRLEEMKISKCFYVETDSLSTDISGLGFAT